MIPELFATDIVNHFDQKVYLDYSSFGSGDKRSDISESEEACLEAFETLVTRIGRFQRSDFINHALLEVGVDITQGEDDVGIIEKEISDSCIFVPSGVDTKVVVKGVRFTTLVSILLQ